MDRHMVGVACSFAVEVIIMKLLLAMGSLSGFSPIHFLIGFLVLICVLAIVIIAVKWLLSLTGLPIPQPLLIILGIILFLILLFCLVSWSGIGFS